MVYYVNAIRSYAIHINVTIIGVLSKFVNYRLSLSTHNHRYAVYFHKVTPLFINATIMNYTIYFYKMPLLFFDATMNMLSISIK